eukprot:jgi/Bigna1/131138/aug1.13_g5846
MAPVLVWVKIMALLGSSVAAVHLVARAKRTPCMLSLSGLRVAHPRMKQRLRCAGTVSRRTVCKKILRRIRQPGIRMSAEKASSFSSSSPPQFPAISLKIDLDEVSSTWGGRRMPKFKGMDARSSALVTVAYADSPEILEGWKRTGPPAIIVKPTIQEERDGWHTLISSKETKKRPSTPEKILCIFATFRAITIYHYNNNNNDNNDDDNNKRAVEEGGTMSSEFPFQWRQPADADDDGHDILVFGRWTKNGPFSCLGKGRTCGIRGGDRGEGDTTNDRCYSIKLTDLSGKQVYRLSRSLPVKPSFDTRRTSFDPPAIVGSIRGLAQQTWIDVLTPYYSSYFADHQ